MTISSKSLIPPERIETRILLIRGQKVMVDSDLARLYGVSTKRLNEQVKRNLHRFPDDFMLHLSAEESTNLRSQFATSRGVHGGRRFRPFVFSEHGAVMLASVLNSKVAIQASIQVVRAFVRLRQVLATHKELTSKLKELEARVENHDESIVDLFVAIRRLMKPSTNRTRPIGFAATS